MHLLVSWLYSWKEVLCGPFKPQEPQQRREKELVSVCLMSVIRGDYRSSCSPKGYHLPVSVATYGGSCNLHKVSQNGALTGGGNKWCVYRGQLSLCVVSMPKGGLCPQHLTSSWQSSPKFRGPFEAIILRVHKHFNSTFYCLDIWQFLNFLFIYF